MLHHAIDTCAVAVDHRVIPAAQRDRLPLDNTAVIDQGFHVAVDAYSAINGGVWVVENVQVAGAAGLDTLVDGCPVGEIRQSIVDEFDATEDALIIDNQVVDLPGLQWTVECGSGEDIDSELVELPDRKVAGSAGTNHGVTGVWRIGLAVCGCLYRKQACNDPHGERCKAEI
ncbi:hypothetical protein Mag101_02890 [Microbulbifer agarilyticus]|uniref:Uncharacterized protein n=1 Tax=Microbulbifer agarilyticus TaxID=260552 RepID=A0A1Q2M1X5_9GAMM|nr:hypothetical protein [Microbulbifer agarilyticus]AQQ66704.1 hypothetical protein Mag101_02890 [Microbulbifer agarilyticus]